VVIQLLIGMIVPLVAIVVVKLFRFPAELRRTLYFLSALLVQVGIFSTRWNVVIGGQLFSKSLRGLTTYKMSIMGIEGLMAAIVLLLLPLVILSVLLRIVPPWPEARNPETPATAR
jgi:predicted membrane protein